MDSRDMAMVLVGIIIGGSVGYACYSMILPYASPYLFPTSLTFGQVNATTLNTPITLTVFLDVQLPPELSTLEPYVRQYLLQDKKVVVLLKTEELWGVYDSKLTAYANNFGVITSSFTATAPGNYTFKAVFEGSSLLKPCETETLTLMVSG